VRKITRNSLKELIRQSIKELGEGGKGSGPNKGDRKGMDYTGMSDDEKEYHKSGQFDKDSAADDTGKDDVPYTDDEEGAGGDFGPPKKAIKKEDKGDMDNDGKNEPDSEEFMDNKDKAIKKAIKNESVRKTTVKEVKKWFKTLEENRYKKTYGSDARRVSWMVNNNLSEDYEAMPVSMKKKWPKAAYKRERFLAKEFVKHLKGETKLRESIRKIISGLINEQKLTEAKKISYDEKDWKKYQKMFEKLSGNKSLMVIDKRGKEYSWEDGSKYGVVVMDRHDRTDSLKHKEIERLEIR